MKTTAPFLVATLVAWVWAAFAAPGIGRSFGVPMISGWNLVRRNQHLSKLDYVRGCGLFAVGSALFIFLTLKQYLYCEFTVGKPPNFHGSYMWLRLVIFLVAGWVFGIATAPYQKVSDLPF